jgi:dTDP-D-glucose 4,6-dehydratase
MHTLLVSGDCGFIGSNFIRYFLDAEPDFLRETAAWYREHADWVDRIRTGEYRKNNERQYGAASA